MKTKINLTIDKELIPLAKRYARKLDKSVSELVESLLRERIEVDQSSFSQKWRGKFAVIAKNEIRYEKLAKRFQI